MAYYMRFFATDKQVDKALLSALISSNNSTAEWLTESQAMLRSGNREFALVDLETPPMEEEIKEFLEFIEEYEGTEANRSAVRDTLRKCASSLVFQVLFGAEGSTEPTLQLLDPIWNWLIDNYSGVIQADGEGFYRRRELILSER